MARANGWISKHGVRPRRRWRKLHLGINAKTHEIVASELTADDVGDISAMPELLDQIETEVASLTSLRGFGPIPSKISSRIRQFSAEFRASSPPFSYEVVDSDAEPYRTADAHASWNWRRFSARVGSEQTRCDHTASRGCVAL
jgi:hypothetical protein